MLLAIDIGNSNVTLGAWDGRSWAGEWRLRTVRDKSPDEYGLELRVLLREFGLNDRIEGIIIASVVPTLTRTFAVLSERHLGRTAVFVNPDTPGIGPIRTDNPYAVGADRIVNAVAAHQYHAGPSLVIDMGTATKVDAISGSGELLGGVIAPGLVLTADALASRAAQLSQVALTAPPSVLGRNTTHAVQSGLIFGHASLIEGIVARLKAELPEPPATVIGTGGLIGYIAPHTAVLDTIEPALTLNGLRLIAERLPG